MKRIAKAIILLILWACAIPGAASAIVMLLWNSIVTATCGFAAIGFWQAAGLFVLGQLLSAGFILGFFLLGAGIHAVIHHDAHRLHSHWHRMSDEQRKQFFNRCRTWMDGDA
ncbi:MAG: hypothetical protein JFR41_01540 [Muribaculaceae bacterium]|nr:hypothetical protein [Muribaculaceae bacterium]